MSKISRQRSWMWVVALLAAVGLGCFLPVDSDVLATPGMDKVAHALYLGLVATLLARKWPAWAVMTFGVLLAVGIEVGQLFTPPRTADVADAAWGMVGTVVAWGVYQWKDYRRILEYRLW